MDILLLCRIHHISTQDSSRPLLLHHIPKSFGWEALVSQQDNSPTIYISRASEILEALNNLAYLICEDAHDPKKIQHYASMVEERLQALRHCLGSNNI